MSERSRADLARAAFDAWNRGDVDAWIDAFHPDCVIDAAVAIRGRPYRGQAGLHQWRKDILESFGEFEIEWEEISEFDDEVLALGRIRITGRESGVGFVQRVGWVARIDEGRISYVKTFTDHDDARRAAASGSR